MKVMDVMREMQRLAMQQASQQSKINPHYFGFYLKKDTKRGAVFVFSNAHYRNAFMTTRKTQLTALHRMENIQQLRNDTGRPQKVGYSMAFVVWFLFSFAKVFFFQKKFQKMFWLFS